MSAKAPEQSGKAGRPWWGLIAASLFVLALPAGIGCGLLDQASRPAEERDSGAFIVVYSVAWLVFFLGMIAAATSLSREERPRGLSFAALALNGIPVLFPLVVLIGAPLFNP